MPAPPLKSSSSPSGSGSSVERRLLNESHVRHIISNFQYADKLLSEIEAVLTATASKSVFPKYVPDVTPAQIKAIEDYIARIRAQLVRVLASFGITPPAAQTGSIHAIRVTLAFIRIAIEESAPRHLAGYGPVPESLIPELEGLSNELEGVVAKLDRLLAQGPGHDLKSRLTRLTQSGDEIEALRKIEAVVSRHGLVEFHTVLGSIVDRLSNIRLEIAIFGQVSSGKSSLLNHILGKDILPVGVNPVTAVPTRIMYGPEEGVTVTFVSRKIERSPITDLPQFVSEQYNSGNAKGVAKIVIQIPAARLEKGIVFVDTPGLGSLATAGAAETRAYLPECDLGVVLINAGSTLSPDDVATIQSLYSAGIAPVVLLSKADLLNSEDRAQALAYISAKLQSELGVQLPVYPVSVIGEHENLLWVWYREQLISLFAEREKLTRESIRRKIGVLRESVYAALRAKVDPRAARVSSSQLEATDRRLRAAAGELSTAEKLCLDKTDAIRDLAHVALRWAAIRLFKTWQLQESLDLADVVRAAIVETAASEAAETLSILSNAAASAAAALDDSARIFDDSASSSMRELQSGLREMPQIETSGIDIKMKRPLARIFGRAIATRVLERRIAQQIGAHVELVFVAYARVLQIWVRDVIGRLQRVFDAQADTYRAQIERLLRQDRGSPAAVRQIEADLQALGETVSAVQSSAD